MATLPVSVAERKRIIERSRHMRDARYRLLVPSEHSASRIIRSAPPDPMRSHAVSAAAKEEEGTLGRRSGRVDVLGGQRSSRPTELV